VRARGHPGNVAQRAVAASGRRSAGTSRGTEAARIFRAEGVFTPQATRTALAALTAPVLVLVGELDLGAGLAAGSAALFPDSTLVVQPGAGHSPWLDDAHRFTATVAGFLG